MHYFLRNCRMNEKIHHFSIRLHVLGRTMPAVLPSFTFMAFYSRRLWVSSWIPKDDEKVRFSVHDLCQHFQEFLKIPCHGKSSWCVSHSSGLFYQESSKFPKTVEEGLKTGAEVKHVINEFVQFCVILDQFFKPWDKWDHRWVVTEIIVISEHIQYTCSWKFGYIQGL